VVADNLKDKIKEKLQFEEKRLPDDGVVRARESGGVDDPEEPDQGSTTGTTPNDEPVGRVAGQDAGYADETGGERRKAAEES
jgi:hypothetical protein